MDEPGCSRTDQLPEVGTADIAIHGRGTVELGAIEGIGSFQPSKMVQVRPLLEPKYEEFQSRTIWSLSNACTSGFKELDPAHERELSKSASLWRQEVFDLRCNFVGVSVESEVACVQNEYLRVLNIPLISCGLRHLEGRIILSP